MLEFCYRCNYAYFEAGTSLLYHYDVYMLADYLMMEELKIHVLDILKNKLGVLNVVDNEKIWDNVFPELVRRVYANTVKEDKVGRAVREMVVDAAHRGLVNGTKKMTLDALRDVMEEFGEFAGDLVQIGVMDVKGRNLGTGGMFGGFKFGAKPLEEPLEEKIEAAVAKRRSGA